ncbi:hypothetical protein UY3_03099 [Chelonia mydas]|uniref:Uncharacterized protein n=1 Tax=Chelonia mydas TaxID=8469 RepID=M7BV75_CHEMY|nr:hypothetical protein UY3_03099 [Chelonia mydas]
MDQSTLRKFKSKAVRSRWTVSRQQSKYSNKVQQQYISLNNSLPMCLMPDLKGVTYIDVKNANCINSAECFHSTEARVDFRSVALWVAIPQFPQSPLPIGILG